MKLHIGRLIAALIVWAVTATDAYAEVMDKEPSIADNWLLAVVGGLLAIAAWRWRGWAGLMVTSVVMFFLLGVYMELQDPFVGPAMRREAGEHYVTHYYAAVVVAVVLNAVGVYLRMRSAARQRGLGAGIRG